MTPLAVLDSWPVGRAAAVVVGPSGVLAGHGDLEAGFHLASVTKPLAALAVLVAAEEEALSLHDDLTGELGDLLPGATVAHLLSHASGIGPERPIRAAAVGSRRIYSNAGFEALGQTLRSATGIGFSDYVHEAVFLPLGMRTAQLVGSPAKDGWASVTDLATVVTELLSPSGFLDSSTLAALSAVHCPGLRGVLPGFGQQSHNDWGLGFEIRADKHPHWTGELNSPATFGHFGRSGTMFWVDPVARLGLVAFADREFDEWAARAWPALSDAVLQAYG